MKRMALFFVLLSLLFSSGCSLNNSRGKITESDFSILNLTNNKGISLGMSKAAVQAALTGFIPAGKKEETYRPANDNYVIVGIDGEFLEVFFKDEKVTEIHLTNNGSVKNILALSHGIELCDLESKITKEFGRTKTKSYFYNTVTHKTYLFQHFNDIEKFLMEPANASVIFLNYYTFSDGTYRDKLGGITIGNHERAKMRFAKSQIDFS